MSYVAQGSVLDDLWSGAKNVYNKAETALTTAQKAKAAADAAKAQYSGGSAPAPAPAPASSGGGMFGLPTWAVLGGVGVLALVLLKKRG